MAHPEPTRHEGTATDRNRHGLWLCHAGLDPASRNSAFRLSPEWQTKSSPRFALTFKNGSM